MFIFTVYIKEGQTLIHSPLATFRALLAACNCFIAYWLLAGLLILHPVFKLLMSVRLDTQATLWTWKDVKVKGKAAFPENYSTLLGSSYRSNTSIIFYSYIHIHMSLAIHLELVMKQLFLLHLTKTATCLSSHRKWDRVCECDLINHIYIQKYIHTNVK